MNLEEEKRRDNCLEKKEWMRKKRTKPSQRCQREHESRRSTIKTTSASHNTMMTTTSTTDLQAHRHRHRHRHQKKQKK